LLLAIVPWFVLLIICEQVIAGAVGAAVGGLCVILGSLALLALLRHRLDHRTRQGMGLERRHALRDLGIGLAVGSRRWWSSCWPR
jgi:hypothetical protein